MRTFLLALLLVGCTNSSEAVQAAENVGLTNVKPGGYAIFGCGRDDISATEFTATNVKGKPVEGVVCCGILKGCTVRFQ